MQGYGQVNMKGKLTRRLGCKCCTAFNFTKLNKYSKVQEQREISEGVNELYSDDEVIYNDPYMKSLYPNANKISSYYHYVCGYDVLVVDGKFAGELNDALELLAYAYHTGENYTNRNDLEMKYYEHLDYGNERWGFLP